MFYNHEHLLFNLAYSLFTLLNVLHCLLSYIVCPGDCIITLSYRVSISLAEEIVPSVAILPVWARLLGKYMPAPNKEEWMRLPLMLSRHGSSQTV